MAIDVGAGLVSSSVGASAVGLAITASTFTTVIVFVPLVFLDNGQIRVYMEDSGAAISLCLLASLLIALTLIPLAASRILRNARIRTSPRIERMGSRYGRVLDWSLRNRTAVMLLLLAGLTVTYYGPIKSTGGQNTAASNTRQVKIKLMLDGDYNIDRAEPYLVALERILEQHREELDVEHIYVQSRNNDGNVQLFLKAEHKPTTEITERVRELVPEFPGGTFMVGKDDFATSPETSTMTLKVSGRDPEILRTYAEQLQERVRGLPDIRDVVMESGRGKPEVRVVVDRTLASTYGVPPALVAQTVAFAFRGYELPEIREGDKEVDVWIQLEEEDRRTLEDLNQVTLTTPADTRIPLGAIARLEHAPAYHGIERERGRRYVELTVESTEESITDVRERISTVLDNFFLPVGYQVSYGDAFVTFQEGQDSIKQAMGMSVALIYLMLGALFESFLLPITILVSVPLAFMGSYWLMWLSDTPMDVAAYIGLIILIGVVVNNAIVIVDRISARRDEHARETPATVRAAIVAAAEDRFRPVIMTAATTIIGLLPLALGDTSIGGSLSFYPMGRVVIGGMVTATLLTLFIVPVLYSLTYELGRFLAALVPKRILPDPEPPAEGTPQM